MYRLLTGLLVLGLASGAFATDIGTHSTVIKTDAHVQPDRGSQDFREGGEICSDAFLIESIPFVDAGATCDNIDDYDETCPYSGSTSPDVVYKWVASMTTLIDIDLYGSEYDTKVYVYETTCGNLVACNDDYYPDWVSKIEALAVTSGNTYYIVVDGYGGDCGNYSIEVSAREVCDIQCEGTPEGEPDLVDYYVDAHNGGCNSSPAVFQKLYGDVQGCLTFCGVSGWYYFDGDFRDTDWFIVTATGTSIDWTVDAEQVVYMFLLGPNECNSADVVLEAFAGPCSPGYLSFATTPGSDYWLWVGPSVFSGPSQPFEFEYTMDICGITTDMTSTKKTSWGGIKKQYR